jgi:DNA-3-methyladenine glycosylase
MGITRALNGADVCSRRSPLLVLPGDPVPEDVVRRGPRVGVSAAADLPWRLWVDGDPTVSSYRPHAPKTRRRA